MATENDWTIRPLRQDEVEAAARFWAVEMGFDVGVYLFQRWYRADPEAFRVVVNKHERIIGSGSAVRQTDSLYFIGTVAVAKDQRGRGIAKKILANLHSRCPGANYGLSAVPDCLAMYQRMGYKPVENMNAYIYTGKLKGSLKPLLPTRDPDLGEIVEVTTSAGGGGGAGASGDTGSGGELVNDLIEYDYQMHGYRRDVLLTLLDDPKGIVFAVRRQGKIAGFGKVQANLRDGGAWLGPLYADDMATAKWLFDKVLRRFEHEARTSLYLIVSEDAKVFAESLSLDCIETSPRCYLRPEPEHLPPMQIDKLFLFDSLDFCLM